MRTKLIKLHKPRRDHPGSDERFTQVNYQESAPFFENPNGVLIHRVRAMYELDATWYQEPHFIVDYWCENGGRASNSQIDDRL